MGREVKHPDDPHAATQCPEVPAMDGISNRPSARMPRRGLPRRVISIVAAQTLRSVSTVKPVELKRWLARYSKDRTQQGWNLSAACGTTARPAPFSTA